MTSAKQDSKEKPKPDKQELEVEVFAPGETEPREFSWSKHMLVGDAANAAAGAFGHTTGSPSLAKGTDVLARDKQLVAAGVRDGDRLELIDIGGGV